MSKSSSRFLSIVVILIICFVMSPTNTKQRVLKSIETLLNIKDGSLIQAYQTIKFNPSTSGTSSDYSNHSQEAKDYFKEICFNTEDGSSFDEASKWTEDVKIYVHGNCPNYMMTELDDIVSELNDLIDPIDIEVVSNKGDANTFLFLGSGKGFKQEYPNMKNENLDGKGGYFSVKSNRAYLYVNMIDTDGDLITQKSILREEVTQSLGLYNDSWKYPSSIFYQGSNDNTEYSDLDKEIIRMLYNE
jgi:hypothetical protein